MRREQYTQIKNCFLRKLKKAGNCNIMTLSLSEFFQKIKKGSKRFRMILDHVNVKDGDLLKCTTINSYAKTTDTTFSVEAAALINLALWNTYRFPNRLKIFTFKFYNNLLGTGNRVVHFNPTAEIWCVFCYNKPSLPAPIESFSHVFFDCPEVNKLLQNIYDKYLLLDLNRNNYFTGEFCERKDDNHALTSFLTILRYCIWQFRLQKRSLNFTAFDYEFTYTLDAILISNKKLAGKINNCNFIDYYRNGHGHFGSP